MQACVKLYKLAELRSEEHQASCVRCAERVDGDEHHLQGQEGHPLGRTAHQFGTRSSSFAGQIN